jgi:formylglycine-generating enzyme required for sulfatase activity
MVPLVRRGFSAALAALALVATIRAEDGGPVPSAGPCGPAVSGMACIPAGEFIRGSDRGPKDERPRETVFVSAFWMDVYEVTTAEYKECVQARACRPDHPNYKNFSAPRQPMSGVSWFGAAEYCRFRGKRLPTEAEWEKAARTTDGRRYPWGNEPATCERAVIKEGEPNGCGRGTPWEVGSRPPNPYGLYDMAGNQWEWVADWYSESYGRCGEECRGRDPKGPCAGRSPCPGHEERVVRGGSWYWDGDFCTTTRRRAHHPGNHPFHHFGFRCARDAAPAAPAPEGSAPRREND